MTTKRKNGYIKQDIGLILLVLTIFIGTLVVNVSDSELFTESLLMLNGIFLVLLFAGFKLNSIAVVAAGMEVLVYTAYRLYLLYAYYIDIPLTSYAWLILPIASVTAMLLFVSGNKDTEMENEVLREQVEEYVMVNALTGMYNLRSMYNDLKRQIAYAERNQMKFSLMLIQIRYEPELRSILSKSRYEAMLQRLAELVLDTVRLEDRTYSIDDKGSIGVILTCDKEGSVYAIRRIKQRVEAEDAFANIAEKAIKVEVKVACLEYDKEKYGEDVIEYKQGVERELQYDV